MSIFPFVSLFILGWLVCLSQGKMKTEKCECKPYLECPRLWSLSRTYQGRRVINTYRCHTHERSFKVCCPKKDMIFKPFPKECGLPQAEAMAISQRIFGGVTAPMGAYPWIAAFLYLNETTGRIQSLCSGSLVNARYVVTAAHCVRDTPGRLLSVRLGEWDMATETDCIEDKTRKKTMCAMKTVDYEIQRIIIHEKYSNITKNFDIALVRLADTVDFTKTKGYISPVCLPKAGWNAEFNMGGSIPEAIGWGLTEVGGKSNRLQRVELPFMPFSKCRKKFPYFRRGGLCVGGKKGEDTCAGDSGGPLMMRQRGRKYLIGIVSYGKGCGLKLPAVYTDVSIYKSWIRHNIVHW